jgi:nucleoside-diphosphate-sugar epimerase
MGQAKSSNPLRVMILGANGFIGSALTAAILRDRDWDVFGIDLSDHKLGDLVDSPRFYFIRGDMTEHPEWVETHIRKADVVVPLVAIANPAQYVTDPLGVFELDFEANLAIVRDCVKYGKRLVFPSTSEIYGMAHVNPLDEETSPMVYGPINKQRWIYAASKQLLDRVIYAYGVRDNFDYTCFRPFNLIGPNLDNIDEPKEGSSRVFTQFLSSIMHGHPIRLVDGGGQRRSFTYIDDGVDFLLRVIGNEGGAASQKIFNVGNPANDVSVKELAELMLKVAAEFPELRERAAATKIVPVASEAYYGKYYQDIQSRIPSVEAARKHLGWQPVTDLETAVRRTIRYYVEHAKKRKEAAAAV